MNDSIAKGNFEGEFDFDIKRTLKEVDNVGP